MPDEQTQRPRPEPPSEWQNVYGFLEEVRHRPGMWLRDGSLRDLEMILIGYRVALDVHGVEERFDFWPSGPFSAWLARYGRWSALGWAAEIERQVEPGTTPLESFFAFLDEYRAEQREDNDSTAK
ncbi:hypothetical protein FHS43_004548 [Streptosporangium becharense]|uniref:Uncharacterized protein n=1 Tax=Streptosporangium becharense TaxID=1816182 RepID=A0A7W9ILB9_9ACTN|nr:hypothetical protein [Streptosporangium becharense]MBB2913250.1 hypothetical protein [Streptosporangium becharense]MBB5822233.1 hypothetical protein [Streptosporangium becharense]